MPTISVTKCQGTGNDFVLLDSRGQTPLDYSRIAQYVCHRRFGIGADGLLVVSNASDNAADLAMHIFNADGSQAEMCGNGIRCVAAYIAQADPKQTALRIQTLSGVTRTAVVDRDGKAAIRVELPAPEFVLFPGGSQERPLRFSNIQCSVFLVSTGNPHAVIFVDEDLDRVDLAQLALQIADWKMFLSPPNVEVARIDDGKIAMRVYERGVGETWACGSGACAVAAVAIDTKRSGSPVSVMSKGGSVTVNWLAGGEHIELTGDAQLVFTTSIPIP